MAVVVTDIPTVWGDFGPGAIATSIGQAWPVSIAPSTPEPAVVTLAKLQGSFGAAYTAVQLPAGVIGSDGQGVALRDFDQAVSDLSYSQTVANSEWQIVETTPPGTDIPLILNTDARGEGTGLDHWATQDGSDANVYRSGIILFKHDVGPNNTSFACEYCKLRHATGEALGTSVSFGGVNDILYLNQISQAPSMVVNHGDSTVWRTLAWRVPNVVGDKYFYSSLLGQVWKGRGSSTSSTGDPADYAGCALFARARPGQGDTNAIKLAYMILFTDDVGEAALQALHEVY